jgi:predicted phosphodiesterase
MAHASTERLGIVADIHGNLAALEAVVADMASFGVAAVVNLGDSLSGPLFPCETARYLMATSWLHIAGNHERQLLAGDRTKPGPSDAYALTQLTAVELDWVRSLPPTRTLDGDVLACHGTPSSDATYFLETVEPDGRVRLATADEIDHRTGDAAATVILCGHTHVPRAVRTGKGRLIVNPGSVGVPAYEDDVPVRHVIETGSTDARYAILDRAAGEWKATLRSVPYDHVSMARLAGERNRVDWERALRTGYVRPDPAHARRAR